MANQGETVLVWERATGRPLSRAISWQDRRAAAVSARLGVHAERLRTLIGLPLDPYFAPPVRWVAPSAIDSDARPPPQNRFTWRVNQFCGPADLIVRQGSRVLWRCRYRQLIPGRPLRAPAEWIGRVDFSGEPVTFAVV